MDVSMSLLHGAVSAGQQSLRQQLDAFLAGVEKQAFRMAMAQLRDRDEALDAVQDAMFRLVRSYSRKPAEQWTPLFFRILMNRVRDAQRRRRIIYGLPEDMLETPAVDDPEQQQAQRDAIMALETALAALPTRQREVVLLRIWEGFDVAMTARIMGCSQGSVKTHLSRALQRLRAPVEEQWT